MGNLLSMFFHYWTMRQKIPSKLMLPLIVLRFGKFCIAQWHFWAPVSTGMVIIQDIRQGTSPKNTTQTFSWQAISFEKLVVYDTLGFLSYLRHSPHWL